MRISNKSCMLRRNPKQPAKGDMKQDQTSPGADQHAKAVTEGGTLQIDR
jgi:hypothetical protein